MWEQAKARAAETGATVVWCDGGRGGLSGFADGRASEVVQTGPGTWIKAVGIEHPFDASYRTAYGRGGQLAAFAVVWAVAGAGFGVDMLAGRLPMVGGARRVWQALLRRRDAQRGSGPPQGNLVDL